jgi:hypothetical protein
MSLLTTLWGDSCHVTLTHVAVTSDGYLLYPNDSWIKVIVFWDVMLSTLVESCQHFRGTYCLDCLSAMKKEALHSSTAFVPICETIWCHIPEKFKLDTVWRLKTCIFSNIALWTADLTLIPPVVRAASHMTVWLLQCCCHCRGYLYLFMFSPECCQQWRVSLMKRQFVVTHWYTILQGAGDRENVMDH